MTTALGRPSNLGNITTNQNSTQLATIERSMREIKSWMNAMQLKMNDNKTEFIYFGGPKQLEKCIINQINVNGEMIP